MLCLVVRVPAVCSACVAGTLTGASLPATPHSCGKPPTGKLTGPEFTEWFRVNFRSRELLETGDGDDDDNGSGGSHGARGAALHAHGHAGSAMEAHHTAIHAHGSAGHGHASRPKRRLGRLARSSSVGTGQPKAPPHHDPCLTSLVSWSRCACLPTSNHSVCLAAKPRSQWFKRSRRRVSCVHAAAKDASSGTAEACSQQVRLKCSAVVW